MLPALSAARLQSRTAARRPATSRATTPPRRQKVDYRLGSDSGISISCIEATDQTNQQPCSEWAVNIQRDSYASYIGHYPMLAYFAIAENESIGRERYNFMQKMLLPCGLPPERDED
ncbi:unnamed protein product [Urochloa humidicola]